MRADFFCLTLLTEEVERWRTGGGRESSGVTGAVVGSNFSALLFMRDKGRSSTLVEQAVPLATEE